MCWWHVLVLSAAEICKKVKIENHSECSYSKSAQWFKFKNWNSLIKYLIIIWKSWINYYYQKSLLLSLSIAFIMLYHFWNLSYLVIHHFSLFVISCLKSISSSSCYSLSVIYHLLYIVHCILFIFVCSSSCITIYTLHRLD